MPLNTLRLNHQKSSHPNDRIVFIKPIPRPSTDHTAYDLADTFLRAIAAQCLPLMKNHYLSVTTLEEHEANPEFVGRNFNNGEIIQLVLQSKDGRWMPFNMVQMVMMHELAHNSHMNHGKLFWKARNLYAGEMKQLWAKGYTGEGFWGSGRTLTDMGAVMGRNVMRSEELESLPLCGGTFRSRNRKRRGKQRQPELTWKEKRDRRIEKKFGKNGLALGEDEDRRMTLELGRKGPLGGKPRVAQSARGRELRAAAALARFDTNKKEVGDLQKAGESTASEDEDGYEDLDADQEDAKDGSGRKILDSRGHGMIRVCKDEDADPADVQHELNDLNTLDRYFTSFQRRERSESPSGDTTASEDDEPDPSLKQTATDSSADQVTERPSSSKSPQPKMTLASKMSHTSSTKDPALHKSAKSLSKQVPSGSSRENKSTAPVYTIPAISPASAPLISSTIPCQICSLENSRLNATCTACAHVIDPGKDPRHWSCQSTACRDLDSVYINAGDVGICGICGQRKAT